MSWPCALGGKQNLEVTCFEPELLQVSWLGLEENAEDPCKFTLTSRSSSGNVERYTLHSTSPGVCQVWIHQVSQILENQRNFLNGKSLV